MSDEPRRMLLAEELVWRIVLEAPNNYHLGELRTSRQNGDSLVVSRVAYERQRRKIHARNARNMMRCRILAPEHCTVNPVRRYVKAKKG